MEEPNANEREQAMGFCNGTIAMQGISKGAHRWILGQVMDFNYLTWIFNLVLAKQLHFGQSHPPTPPHLSLVAPFVGSIMVMQRGGDVTTRQVHPWQLWDQGCQIRTFMGVEQEISDVGAPRHDGTFPHFA
jgi:hypothetical protein